MSLATTVGAVELAEKGFLEPDLTLTSDNPELKKSRDKEFLGLINEVRQSCSLGELLAEGSLHRAAQEHTEYLRYLDEQRPIETIIGASPLYAHLNSFKMNSPHYQQRIKGLHGITGKSNPFFLAKTPKQRIRALGYKGLHDGMEVIGYPREVNAFSRKYRKHDDSEFKSLLTGLLSVPYHASILLNPAYNETGVSYSLHRVNVNNPKQGIYDNRYAHTVVVEVGRKPKALTTNISGVSTYPCEGTVLRSSKMQMEEPNPLESRELKKQLKGRDAGHPIHVVGLNPDSKIKVSNVLLEAYSNAGDTKRIDTYILHRGNDPHKILSKNQAFILPLQELRPGNYQIEFHVEESGGESRRKKISFSVS